MVGKQMVPTKFQWFFWGSLYIFFAWTLKLKCIIAPLFNNIGIKNIESIGEIVEK